ncbi:MAG TPA: hypothetical protein VGG06_11260 [Thermoanaerobaculia bacterium]
MIRFILFFVSILLPFAAEAADPFDLTCSTSAHCIVRLPAGEELLDILIADAGAWTQETGSFASPPRHWIALRPNAPCPAKATRATFVTAERIVSVSLRADCESAEATDLALEPLTQDLRGERPRPLPMPALDTAFLVRSRGLIGAGKRPSVVADETRLYLTWPRRLRRLPELTLKDEAGKALTVPNPRYDEERATLTLDYVLEAGESLELAFGKRKKLVVTRPR